MRRRKLHYDRGLDAASYVWNTQFWATVASQLKNSVKWCSGMCSFNENCPAGKAPLDSKAQPSYAGLV